MSYRLELDQPLPDALRAVAVERLERAAERMRPPHHGDTADAVHGARKDLKKTRALLRLARPGLPSDLYRLENRALRDIGRAMSAGRDADVMVETAGTLSEVFADHDVKGQFAALRRELAARARDEADVETLAASLEQATSRARDWPLEDCDARTLVAGERRIYRAGRRALAAIEHDPSDERWHEWRKRVKDLWYHHRLLVRTWRGPMKAYADELDRLATLLGDDHDLATLAETLRADAAPAPPSVDLRALLDLIAVRRGGLQPEARSLGHRIYAERPKAHGRRIGSYLAAAAPQPV